MAAHSDIQWTDATWNPTTGCTKVSPGCANCYIARTPPFRIQGRRFVKGDIPLLLHDERLGWPQKWKQSKRIFVNSLSDLFHADVPEQFLHDVYHVMEQRAHWHTYQILTKRPERMLSYLAWRYDGRIPSRHIWHGVSVENAHWKSRIDLLRQVPSRVRFLSIEPLLGDVGTLDLRGIHWVIVGGESGGRPRPMYLAWVRAIKEQCEAAGVPLFIKQLGARPYVDDDLVGFEKYREAVTQSGYEAVLRDKKGGDPSEWPEDLRVREFPEVRA